MIWRWWWLSGRGLPEPPKITRSWKSPWQGLTRVLFPVIVRIYSNIFYSTLILFLVSWIFKCFNLNDYRKKDSNWSNIRNILTSKSSKGAFLRLNTIIFGSVVRLDTHLLYLKVFTQLAPLWEKLELSQELVPSYRVPPDLPDVSGRSLSRGGGEEEYTKYLVIT